MNKLISLVNGPGRFLSLLFLASTAVAGDVTASDSNLEAQAKARIQPFASQLLETVQEAIRRQGAPGAVEACQLMAPQVADLHSQSGWRIGRTSMKVRNPENAPDAWERAVLERFQEEMARGRPVKELNVGEWVGGEYRYMQAIPVGEPCLACHGENIDPRVRAVLQERYPRDQATGFKVGDLRGAFTLRKHSAEVDTAQ